MEAEVTFISPILLSESIHLLGYFLFNKKCVEKKLHFHYKAYQALQCAFVGKMIRPMKILFENVGSVEYCSGEEYWHEIQGLGFDFWLCQLPV